MSKRLSHDDYKVGWICPLQIEQIAAMEMLDEEHASLPQSPADHNVYSLGRIAEHNVVIAGLHGPGNNSAATVITQMRMTFRNLRYGLLVGIGGGVPVETEEGRIRLGHVVISRPTGTSSGAVQYDHGKARDGKFERTGALAPPPTALLNAVRALEVRRARAANDFVAKDIKRIDTSLRKLRCFSFPGIPNDRLYQPGYLHNLPGASCSESGCDDAYRIERASDDDGTYVNVHAGTIASGELVVKDAQLRDLLAKDYGVLCFEMEAAGALVDFPCLVIRGISDYCDSHKNDDWHGYAAAAAAAYARQLFMFMPVDDVPARFIVDRFTLTLDVSEIFEVNRFIARERELKRLHEILGGTFGQRRTAVLQGLGGIGKTQLSAAYIRRFRKHYTAVLWLNARDEDSLRRSLTRVAKRILQQHPFVSYIKNAQDFATVIEGVKRWLDESGNEHWLAIYDNYDDVDFGVWDPQQTDSSTRKGQRAYDIRRFLPNVDQGAVIITTRSTLVKIGECIHLRKLGSVDDSMAILSSMSNRPGLEHDPSAIELANRLDGLPLALATAGAYLDQVTTTCREYLRLYETSWLRLQQASPMLPQYDRAMYSTWNISYNHVEHQNKTSALLLRAWAYFDKEDLWYELLKAGSSRGPKWLRDLTEDKLAFDTGMRILFSHDFVEAGPPINETGQQSQGYSVHECVHEWMKNALNDGADNSMARTAMVCVASHIHEESERESWWLQRRLLQHTNRCRELIDTVELEFDDEWILMAVGNLYTHQNRLDEAKDMYSRALTTRTKVLGAEHQLTLDCLHGLGNLYLKQGKLTKAERMYKDLLTGREKGLSADDDLLLDALHCLGYVYALQGEHAKAEYFYDRALAGYRKGGIIDGDMSNETFGNIQSLGNCENQYAKRERKIRAALKLIGNLGTLYEAQNRPRAAEWMFKQAMRGYEQLVGCDDPLTLSVVNNLGLFYKNVGQFQEAETMYEKALQGYERSLGSVAVKTFVPALTTLSNLGRLYERLGRVEEAMDHYMRAQDGILTAQGPDCGPYRLLSDWISSLEASR
ncbi:hypothetical protein GCG54_00002458 [Colletotrichum gloeosporioides]|uniref:Nucleoside phosphorylase domain-containing protein n=1 Tax=Colletotrichum gloeosporioides TaxID=474922 RepID=A0A8H4CTR5_COLGL|nr:uncharacterized protein GCG54_00002458 [Colletotrichum gloeosporioides]KAF3810009.1 hypothetical protein GCG54_00002458 [Colletotrichum gloeosporioides]